MIKPRVFAPSSLGPKGPLVSPQASFFLVDLLFGDNEKGRFECELAASTLQGINISHLGKRNIIFKMPFLGRYVSSLEGIHSVQYYMLI